MRKQTVAHLELAADRGAAFVDARNLALEAALVAAAAGRVVDASWTGANQVGESTADEVAWLREVAKQFSTPRRPWHNGATIRSGAGRVA